LSGSGAAGRMAYWTASGTQGYQNAWVADAVSNIFSWSATRNPTGATYRIKEDAISGGPPTWTAMFMDFLPGTFTIPGVGSVLFGSGIRRFDTNGNVIASIIPSGPGAPGSTAPGAVVSSGISVQGTLNQTASWPQINSGSGNLTNAVVCGGSYGVRQTAGVRRATRTSWCGM
jgi:hypothetical protein